MNHERGAGAGAGEGVGGGAQINHVKSLQQKKTSTDAAIQQGYHSTELLH